MCVRAPPWVYVRSGVCVLCSQVNGVRGSVLGARFCAHPSLYVRVGQGPGCVGDSGRGEGALISEIPATLPLLEAQLGRGTAWTGRRVSSGPQAWCACGVGMKPCPRRGPGGVGKAEPSRFIWDPLPGGSRIQSVPSRPRTEVWVPNAAVSANRLGAEVSAGCVSGPWERVGTRPLRASEEVTHGDQKTPGNGAG